MMKQLEIALIRHGITAYNLRGAYIGSLDAPLCEEGIAELKRITPPPADLLITSDLLRCRQTGETLYPHLQLFVEPLLRERDFGEFEGLTHKEITSYSGFGGWGMTVDSMVFPGGEGKDAFLGRCRAAFARVLALSDEQGTGRIAVITHGGVIMAFLSDLFPGSAFYSWQCSHGGGYLLAGHPDSGFNVKEVL